MSSRSLTISYFYYNYYPAQSGSAVHGLNLAKELSLRGHRLLKVTGTPDPYTEKKGGIFGLLYSLVVSDIIFVRIDFFWKLKNWIPVIAKVIGKRVMVELNSPSDELLLFGYSEAYKNRAEKRMRFITRFADKMLVVSSPVKSFCEKVLRHPDIHVVENGGEKFEDDELKVDDDFREKVQALQTSSAKLMIWAGSVNKVQELNFLNDIGKYISDKDSLVIAYNTRVISDKKEFFVEELHRKKNVHLYPALSRDELKYLMLHAHVGLALYGDYSWCRWGFYNSSVKFYEYLSNGLWVFTNKRELLDRRFPVRLIEDPQTVSRLLQEIDDKPVPDFTPRTWKQVAIEVEEQMMQLVAHD